MHRQSDTGDILISAEMNMYRSARELERNARTRVHHTIMHQLPYVCIYVVAVVEVGKTNFEVLNEGGRLETPGKVGGGEASDGHKLTSKCLTREVKQTLGRL